MTKRPAPVGEDGRQLESKEAEAWRLAPKRRGSLHTELPASLMSSRVDREAFIDAEVVRRARPPQVPISIGVVAALQPAHRARWLSRALDDVERGTARPSDTFDVLVHKRFAVGISAPLATRMLAELRGRLPLFPDSLRQVLCGSTFGLAQAAATCEERGDPGGAGERGAEEEASAEKADEIMARCVDFIRKNEAAIAGVHEMATRTFQVELQRESVQQVWGLTWSRAAFAAKRRVLEAIVAGTPAGHWNERQEADGERCLQPGDELVALNGGRGWEAMAPIKNLLHAILTFQREPPKDVPNADSSAVTAAELPPPFAEGGYTQEAGDGWFGHTQGQWLYSKLEAVYFHPATGALFVETAEESGKFVRLGANDEATDTLPVRNRPRAKPAPVRRRGKLRWFSRPKGFGFIVPDVSGPPGTPAVDDVFVHRTELLEDVTETGDRLPLLPGMPLTYTLGAREKGKMCAMNVSMELDLASLCGVSFSAGSSARVIEKAAMDLKAHSGQSAVGLFTGVATGHQGVGGAEYVAIHLPRELAHCLQGRDQGGEKGAKAALRAAFRQTQHGFLQYAQQLSENSAGLWLSAATTACTALVLGPDADGRPLVILTSVGNGRALVVKSDGTVAASLGAERPEEPGKREWKAPEDNLKAFDRGLKGPAIAFPPIPGYERREAAKGFGAPAWSEKEGSSAGLQLEVYSHPLEWEEDVALVIGSEAMWKALPADDEVATKVLESLRSSTSKPLQSAVERLDALASEARGAQGGTAEDRAVAVVRFYWCPTGGDSEPIEDCTPTAEAAPEPLAEPSAPAEGCSSSSAEAGLVADATAPPEPEASLTADADVDDMFAAPTPPSRAAAKRGSVQEAGADDGAPASSARPRSANETPGAKESGAAEAAPKRPAIGKKLLVPRGSVGALRREQEQQEQGAAEAAAKQPAVGKKLLGPRGVSAVVNFDQEEPPPPPPPRRLLRPTVSSFNFPPNAKCLCDTCWPVGRSQEKVFRPSIEVRAKAHAKGDGNLETMLVDFYREIEGL